MKTIYKTTVLTLTICLLFASCATKLTISKRHYKKGYYVSFTKKQAKPLSNSLANKSASIPLKNIEEKPETIVVLNTPQQNPSSINVNNQSKSSKANKKETPSKVSSSNNHFVYIYPDKKHQIGLRNMHKSSMGDSDEGHSLLWIVVVVLIVLWALGIISGSFGLGILINLLLVIAFVLLILWLLRII